MNQALSLKKVRIYFAFQFCFSMLVWLPVFYEIQKHYGLTDNQIFKIQSIYYLFFCLIEIPTGFIADRFEYRVSMKIGAIFLFISNIIAIISPDYFGFLWHWIIIAIARSFISGASSSYLYEHLKSLGFTKGFKEIEGKARAFSLLGKVVCFSGVSILLKLGYLVPYWITAGFALTAVFISTKLESTTNSKNKLPRPNSVEQLKKSFKVYPENPWIILVMIQGIGVFVLNRIILVNLFQPILKQNGIALGFHGFIMSAMILCEAIGSLRPDIPEYYLSKLSNKQVLYNSLLAVGLLLTATEITWFVLPGLLIFSYASGLAGPLQSQQMNDVIPDSSIRATVLSTESIFDRAICSIVAFIVGPVLTHHYLNQFLISAAVLSVGLVVISQYYLKRSRVIN